MKLKDILKEDYEQDEKFRRVAGKVANELIENLFQKRDLIDIRPGDPGRFSVSIDVGEFSSTHEEKNFDDLRVVFRDKSNSKSHEGILKKYKGNWLMRLNICDFKSVFENFDIPTRSVNWFGKARENFKEKLKNTDLKSELLKEVKESLKEYRRYFIHEYIHFLDRSLEGRVGGDLYLRGTPYFERGPELNAFFQMAVEKFQNDLKNNDISLGLSERGDYKRFVDWFIDNYLFSKFREFILKDENEKYYRKFVKRLYPVWKDYVKS